MSDTGSRLSRWSRLKSEARQQTRVRFAVPEEEAAGAEVAPEAPVVEAAAPTEDHGPPDVASVEGNDAPEGAADDDLPDIETLDASSDYTAFMSDKVSDTVRNLALRKLWRTDAVFANLDGLIDYGEDFTDAATVVEGMKSTYTVGRGMVDYEAEEAAKLAQEAEQGEAEQAEAANAEDGVAEGEDGAETAPEEPAADPSDAAVAGEHGAEQAGETQDEVLLSADVGVEGYGVTHSSKEEKHQQERMSSPARELEAKA